MDQVDTNAFVQPPTPEAAVPNINTPASEETKKKSSSGLIAFLIVLILALVGFIAYAFFTDKLDIGIENPLSQRNEVGEENNSVVVAYKNDEVGVEFQLPNDWEVRDEEYSKLGDTSYFTVDFAHKTNQNWVIKYNLGRNSGPEGCVYTDPASVADHPGTIYYNNYKELMNGKYRASLGFIDDTKIYSYEVCYQGDNTNANWTVWVEPGYLRYEVPEKDINSNEFISDVENIIGSFKYTGDIFWK